MGPEGMLGLEGRVVRPLDPEGTILVSSERWKARADNGGESIPEDARVEVVGIEGWTLAVRLLEGPPDTASETPQAESAAD